LTTGLRLVEALEGALPEDLVRRLRDLQMKRNRSYLEHGYLRVTQQDGKRLLDAAHAVCSHLMGTDLTPIRDQISHRTIK
jgi:hypothetical protein